MDRTVTTNKLTCYLAHLLLLLALFTSAAAHSTERITYYHNDNLGSPVAATDTQGNVVWRESFQPDGTRLQHQGDNQNKLWFTGKQEEDTYGVSYFGARWYDSEMGRFLGMDPVGVSPSNPYSFNRYAYANNNPYRFLDHDGRDSDDLAVGGYWSGDDIGRLTGTNANIPDEVKAQTLEISLLMLSDVWLADVAPGIAVINTAATSDVPLCVVPNSAKSFRNLAPAEAIGDAVTFPASQIAKVSYSGKLNYVVKESGELVIGRTGHTSLSGGGNVLAAGEARFVNGELRALNNASGHYKPSGSSAQSAAESAFQRAGFESAGKYGEKF